MSNYHFKLSVQLRHPSADLGPIPAAVGRVPTSIWKQGERKRDRAGSLVGDVMFSSYCSFAFEPRPGADLDAAIAAATLALEPARALLEQLQKSGGEASVAIGWITSGDSGDVVSSQSVRALASLGLSIQLYVYSDVSPTN